MTDAGTQWLVDYIKEHHPPEYGNMVGAMEYGIRAFCDEIERRATQVNRGYDGHADWCVAEAFKSVKRELLGQ